jgi:hypothetical protein
MGNWKASRRSNLSIFTCHKFYNFCLPDETADTPVPILQNQNEMYH